jgi:1-acyl-sn-glycerol-3-phosphate acyltransferase
VLQKLRYGLQGGLMFIMVTISTVTLTLVVCVLSLFKLLTRKGRFRYTIPRWSSSIGELWVSSHKALAWFYRDLEWEVELPEGISHEGRYLVCCNHQSSVDILALQHCLNRKAPFGRYLLKQQLIWVPVLGIAWWVLDMVFVRRYSRQELIRNPALRGKDLENAARACEKLKHIPVSMMTFPEGTRFTEAKRDQQHSPYRHLLKPKYGGVGQVLYSFDDALDSMIDVTITYPGGVPTIWQYMSGQVKKICIYVRLRPIAENLRGADFRQDPGVKNALKGWLDGIWAEKEDYIATKMDNISEPRLKLGGVTKTD